MKNKVIIIGNDHVNTLGVIRTFGENGIYTYLIIVSSSNNISVNKSKYIKKTWRCNSEEEAMLTLLSEFGDEDYKPIIITTTDGVALVLDENYDKLKNKFIISSINDCSKKISKYMDKYKQFKLASDNGVNVAKTNIVDLNEKIIYNYPCILKPIISAKGKKDDIKICNSEEELNKACQELKKLNYDKVLSQELLSYDYEIDIAGFAYNGNVCIPGYIKKERIWPAKRGSTTYGMVNNINDISQIVDDLKKILKKINYNGVFDIDVFIMKDYSKTKNYYLNEINFRNGALSYAYGKAYICYYWYLSNMKEEYIPSPSITESYYFIDDQADLHNIIDRVITYHKYRLDKKNSNILLEYNQLDLKPARTMKINKIFNRLKINKVLDFFYKVCHKDKTGTIYRIEAANLKKSIVSNNYNVIKINCNNYEMICESEEEKHEFGKIIKSKNVYGIALMKKNEVICRGFIKGKCAIDRFFKITKGNSFVISNLYVKKKFRGKNYQINLINELVNNYAGKDAVLYSFVYKYNIPSIKNFEKIGFVKKDEITIKRFLKMSINKYRI